MAGAGARVAVVTGGSRGIGRQVALRLAADGYALGVVFAGNRSEADAVVAEIDATRAEAGALALQADVADEVAVAEAFDAVEARFGGVDVVVNAAGIMPLSTIADLDLEVLDRVYRTNVRGSFAVSQQAVRRVRDGGAIVNFSTSVTRLQIPGYGAYAASKGAVEAMTLIPRMSPRPSPSSPAPGAGSTGRSSTSTAALLDPTTRVRRDGSSSGNRTEPGPSRPPTCRAAKRLASGSRRHGGRRPLGRLSDVDRGHVRRGASGRGMGPDRLPQLPSPARRRSPMNHGEDDSRYRGDRRVRQGGELVVLRSPALALSFAAAVGFRRHVTARQVCAVLLTTASMTRRQW
jgi:NADP-dependent 3-hydroxy acid dehydrogenase YdfG